MTPIFGRGDDLGDDVEPPPVAHAPREFRVPGYRAEPIAFGAPPDDEVELTGEIPWELRDDEPAPSE